MVLQSHTIGVGITTIVVITEVSIVVAASWLEFAIAGDGIVDKRGGNIDELHVCVDLHNRGCK